MKYDNFDFRANRQRVGKSGKVFISDKPLVKTQVGALLIAIRPDVAKDSHIIHGGARRPTIPLRTKGRLTKAERNREWYMEPTWAAGWAQFPHGALPMILCRNPMGCLNGYVGVGRSHQLFGVAYNQTAAFPPRFLRTANMSGWSFARSILMLFGNDTVVEDYHGGMTKPEWLFNVHGGLTYSDDCAPCKEAMDSMGWKGGDYHWFGFDTAHCYDITPGMLEDPISMEIHLRFPISRECSYRNFEYVSSECRSLASQLLAARMNWSDWVVWHSNRAAAFIKDRLVAVRHTITQQWGRMVTRLGAL